MELFFDKCASVPNDQGRAGNPWGLNSKYPRSVPKRHEEVGIHWDLNSEYLHLYLIASKGIPDTSEIIAANLLNSQGGPVIHRPSSYANEKAAQHHERWCRAAYEIQLCSHSGMNSRNSVNARLTRHACQPITAAGPLQRVPCRPRWSRTS